MTNILRVPRPFTPWRTAHTRLLLLALMTTACAEQATEPLTARPEIQPQHAFSTPGSDLAFGTAVHGSGIYVVGYTTGSLDGPNRGSEDAIVRKYDPDGFVLWADQFGTQLTELAQAVAVDAAGNAYVAGYTNGSLAGNRGAYDGFIRKYSPAGSMLWMRQFGTAYYEDARGVAVDPSGNVFVTGRTFGTFEGVRRYGSSYVRKYSSAGIEAWTVQFGSTDRAVGIASAATGDVYVVGSTSEPRTNTGGVDAFLRKINGAGVAQWQKQFGTLNDEYANAVTVDAAGNAIVVGETLGTLKGAENTGGSDAFVRKYGSGGAVLFTHQFGQATASQYATSVSALGDGSFVVGTWIEGGVGFGGRVVKYSAANRVQWTSSLLSSGGNEVYGVAADGTGIYVAGAVHGNFSVPSVDPSVDAFVRRLSSTGAVVWTDR